MARKEKYNRIKVVLAQKDRTNTWLAGKMKVTPVAVSRWCTNDAQPDIPTLFKIAKVLGVPVTELLNQEA